MVGVEALLAEPELHEPHLAVHADEGQRVAAFHDDVVGLAAEGGSELVARGV